MKIRQLTKPQKMWLANIVDPQARNTYKRQCADLNEYAYHRKMEMMRSKGNKKDEAEA